MDSAIWVNGRTVILMQTIDELIRNEKTCFYCQNAFVDDNDQLHCMADGHDHEKTVEDDESCDDFN